MPIVFLSAKAEMEDIHKGFIVGADDYISKPFNTEEVALRLNAIIRRVYRNDKEKKEIRTLHLGDFVFDKQKQSLTKDGKTSKLTYKESKLLELFVENINKLVERDFALKTIWQDNTYFNARSMDVYISKLRKLLKQDPSLQILNLHGEGYKLIDNFMSDKD